jgi:electron transfer flavoprotein beta subunit
MPLPALLAIQSGFSKLRYATLMGIKKAKTKQVRRVTAADLGVEGPEGAPAASVTIERLYLPQRSKRTQLFEGTPRQAAAQLVEKLRFEARVI